MTDEATVTVGTDDRLTVGHAPVRLAATGNPATVYIVECAHGSTQLHEVQGVDPTEVSANLVSEHNARLGCTCQPA